MRHFLEPGIYGPSGCDGAAAYRFLPHGLWHLWYWLAAFGLAAICGTWTAKQIGTRIAPNFLLIFGPGISGVSVIILYVIPQGGSVFGVYAAFFLLGYGPSMWRITQNSAASL
ncbi:MAG: putative MFS family arabinose efflux permease [Paracoccaceae bacterium]|jgi:predicted MFS family arabinose efflux permease